VQDFFFAFVGKWSYLGLILVLLAAGFGAPIPEDIPLLAAGWLVYKGSADFTLMIATALIGVLLGDTIIFTLGRRYGMRILEHRFLRRMAKPWLLERAQALYDGHGAKMLFAARFMPGFRAVVFLNAGIFKVPYWKFIAFDGGAALISVPVWVWVGCKFSQHVHRLLGEARLASYVIGALLVAALIFWGLWEHHHLLKKRRLLEAERAAAAAGGPTGPATPDKTENPHQAGGASKSGLLRSSAAAPGGKPELPCAGSKPAP
jgi:membrane protein DedA with SNARE-associated domain